MADIKMKKIESFDSMASVPTPVSTATPKYITPSMRAAAASGATTPKSLDLNSASFPSLGGPGTSPKTVSWSQLRNRLVEPVLAPTPVASPATTALNFKDMIHARIEKDEAEAAERELPESESPDELSDEQLKAAGWTKLVLPGAASRVRLQVSLPSEEGKDPDLSYMNESWDWTQMGIPEEIMNSGDSHSLLNYLCRPGRAGEDPWAQGGYTNDLANLLGTAPSAVKETTSTKAFHALLERKKQALRSTAMAATAE
jgi:hypothetical protein